MRTLQARGSYGQAGHFPVRIVIAKIILGPREIAMSTFANRASVPSHVLVRFLDNEAVLLNLSSEKYFGLDETGTRMWQLATTSPNIDTAYQELLAEYDVAPELLHDNLTKLLIELVENGLLEVRPGDTADDVAST